MKKKLIAILSILCIAMLLTGCDEMLDTYEDTDTPRLDVSQENNKLEKIHTITDQLTIKTYYSTINYDTKKWLITDNKTVNMNLAILNAPEGTEVFVEHVHADVAIAATKMHLNGLVQDSMDDTFHGNGTIQPGWFVTKEHPYEETFSIEGYSQLLIEGYGYYVGGYGYNSTGTNRMTESRLKSKGAYGNQLTIVYNLAIKYPGEEYYHSETIYDTFIIHSTGDAATESVEEITNVETQIVVALDKAKDEGKTSWTTTDKDYIKFLNDNKERFKGIGYTVEKDGVVSW